MRVGKYVAIWGVLTGFTAAAGVFLCTTMASAGYLAEGIAVCGGVLACETMICALWLSVQVYLERDSARSLGQVQRTVDCQIRVDGQKLKPAKLAFCADGLVLEPNGEACICAIYQSLRGYERLPFEFRLRYDYTDYRFLFSDRQLADDLCDLLEKYLPEKTARKKGVLYERAVL